MADPKVNRQGYVVLTNKKTGAVQEFVPESVDVWLDAGWSEASDTDTKKAMEEGTLSVSSAKPAADKEN